MIGTKSTQAKENQLGNGLNAIQRGLPLSEETAGYEELKKENDRELQPDYLGFSVKTEIRQGYEKAKETRRKQRGRSMMLLGFRR